jgi:glycosyltransferase involved in cell wall biosynthesis
MRILLVHNRYRSLGGEERAIADIFELLTRRGHAVELLERSSSDVSRARAAGALLVGGADPGAVGAAVKRLGAEVVHAHNLHPLFGWRALAAARAAGARTVLHLHNFRLFCAIGVAYRDGAPCFRCRGRNTLPGLGLRCRGSLGEAAVYAAALHRQQAQLFAQSDRFVVVSNAQGSRLRELGLPNGRTTALPNFAPTAHVAARSAASHGRYALVAGRLVEEKGYDTAIRAARAANVPLVIAGSGPDEARLRRLADGSDVRFAGLLSPGGLSELRQEAAVVLVPSRWEEPCPYAVIDALAAGIPVLASDRGGLPELVGPGAVLDPDNIDGWVSGLRELWEDPARRAEAGAAALERARDRLGEDLYYDELMRVYAGD